MKKYVYIVFVLLLSVSLFGCTTNTVAPSSREQVNSSNDYQNVVQDFFKQKNLKIVVNSGAADDIQLPTDFNAVKDGVPVGELLRQRNELSKQNALDFAKYMGQKVKIYTAQIDTGDAKSNYEVVLLIADNQGIGYWKDSGREDPKQNRPDFNFLRDLLSK